MHRGENKECDISPCLKYWPSAQFQELQFCKDHLDLVIHVHSGKTLVSRFQTPALHPRRGDGPPSLLHLTLFICVVDSAGLPQRCVTSKK